MEYENLKQAFSKTLILYKNKKLLALGKSLPYALN